MPGPAITSPAVTVIDDTGVTEVDLTPAASTTQVHTIHRLELAWNINTTVKIVRKASGGGEVDLTGLQYETSSLLRDYSAEFPWYAGQKDDKIIAKFGASVNVGGAALVKSKTVPA